MFAAIGVIADPGRLRRPAVLPDGTRRVAAGWPPAARTRRHGYPCPPRRTRY